MALILPGNYQINYLTINSSYGRGSIDLKAIYQQVNIFESILTPAVSGYVTVTDTYNLISGLKYSLPIMGNEVIYIQAELPACFVQDENGNWVKGKPNIIDFYGRVTDIKNISLVNEGAKNYEIHFTSEELILDRSLKISKSYKDAKISDIVASVFTESFPKTFSSFQFETTQGLQTIVVPNWIPIQTINWLASRAISAANKRNSCFFFYQTLYSTDGYNTDPQNCFGNPSTLSSSKYWFLSLDELISDWNGGVRKTILYIPANNGANISPTNPEIYMKFANALNYEVVHSFDTLENTSAGMFASRLIHHDITKKTFTTYDYNYDSAFANYLHVDSNPLFSGVINSTNKNFSDPSYSNSHIMVAPTGTNETPNHLEQISYTKLNRIKSLDTFRLKIIVPGDGLIQAGDLINFKLPSLEVGGNGQVYDTFYDGKYLVTSIRHTFTRKEYKMTLDCSKESLTNDVRSFNPKNA